MLDTKRTGFTLIEMLMVIVVIGALLGVALPYFRTSTSKSAARGAGDAITSLNALARATAIERGRQASLVLATGSNSAVVVANRVTSTGVDTVGKVEDLYERFGVTVRTTRDTLKFSPRGIGLWTSTVTIVVSKGGFSDTLLASTGGRMTR